MFGDLLIEALFWDWFMAAGTSKRVRSSSGIYQRYFKRQILGLKSEFDENYFKKINPNYFPITNLAIPTYGQLVDFSFQTGLC